MLKTFSWDFDAGANKNTEVRTNSVKFGDVYEQVSSWGINNTQHQWELSVTGTEDTINEVNDFLMEHKGVTPFYANVNGERKTYRTVGSIGQSHVGHDVWTISFTVKQVFRP